MKIIGDTLVGLEINLKLGCRQGPFRPLEQVVNSLGRLEKLGSAIDDHPLRVQPQGIHQGRHGLKDFSDAAAGGGAVNMDHSHVAEFLGQGCELIGQIGGHDI